MIGLDAFGLLGVLSFVPAATVGTTFLQFNSAVNSQYFALISVGGM